jgi:hypothetical protein
MTDMLLEQLRNEIIDYLRTLNAKYVDQDNVPFFTIKLLTICDLDAVNMTSDESKPQTDSQTPTKLLRVVVGHSDKSDNA